MSFCNAKEFNNDKNSVNQTLAICIRLARLTIKENPYHKKRVEAPWPPDWL